MEANDELPALHVNWTKPAFASCPEMKQYDTSDFNILTTILSALLWRKYNGPIKLYTDSIGLEYYRMMEMTSIWDEIDTNVIDNMPDNIHPSIFWAGAKLFAMREQTRPFCMMDTDLMVWRSIIDDVKGKQAMAYHVESLEETEGCYIPFEHLKKRTDYKPDPDWDWTANPFNMALSYFSDLDFMRYYCGKAIDFMTGNNEMPMEMVTQMVFAEQRIITMCAIQKHVFVDTFLDYPDERGKGFTHIWGFKMLADSDPTANDRLCTQLVKAIRLNFPDLHQGHELSLIFNKYGK